MSLFIYEYVPPRRYSKAYWRAMNLVTWRFLERFPSIIERFSRSRVWGRANAHYQVSRWLVKGL